MIDPHALNPAARDYMKSYVGNIVGALRTVYRLGPLSKMAARARKKERQRGALRIAAKHGKPHRPAPERVGPDVEPDWSGKCENCGASPVMPVTGMCGPCTFGEADTAGGEW